MKIFAYLIICMKTPENSVVKTAEALKALGHPVRVEMLRIISASRAGQLTVKQIHESLGITQPEASKHLSVLRNQDILLCEKKGGYSYYRISYELGFIKQLLNSLKDK
jgi:ArsR family transcriptional regulator, arsenate/arsenite/antimonite-responsive transcriptional repressor